MYTPDELGADDPDADVAPADDAAPRAVADPAADDQEDRGPGLPPGADLTEAALEGGYSAATVVELCRFFYGQPALTELGDEQATEMAGRLRLARVQGVGDERLLSLAKKGLGMADLPRARRAADLWLTFRGSSATPDATA